jgi:Cu/Ag efflux pump CusA
MFLVSGGVITLGSLLGLITIFGIAARNGVLLIRHYQQLEDEEGEAFGPDLVLRGGRERLPPVLTTALITALAFLPLAIAGDVLGSEILRPMAIAILGGLVTSTLLNLLVIPALYLRFGAHREADLGLVPGKSSDAVVSDPVAGD